MTNTPVDGYKGFDSNFRCRGYQFEVGKTYTHDGEVKLCQDGFHFCCLSSDVLDFYPEGRYARVRAFGTVIHDSVCGTKSVCSRLEILEEITRDKLLHAMPTFVERPDGNKMWYMDGVLHRSGGNDLPAIKESNGTLRWYKNGLQHRSGEPAVIYPNGTKMWFKNGLQHRSDGPAVMSKWTKMWFRNGKLHRDDDLPAIENPDGAMAWYKDGLLCNYTTYVPSLSGISPLLTVSSQ